MKVAKWFWMGMLALCVCLWAGEVWAGSFTIDSVYDDVNGEWFDAAPTLIQGQDYQMTVEVTGGYDTYWSNMPANDINYVGMFMDWDYDGVYDERLFAGDDNWSPNDFYADFKYYTITGLITIPTNIPVGIAKAFVYSNSGGHFTDADSALLPWGEDHISGGASVKEFFDVNVAKAVPEPASLSLLGFGVLGLLGRFRKRV